MVYENLGILLYGVSIRTKIKSILHLRVFLWSYVAGAKKQANQLSSVSGHYSYKIVISIWLLLASTEAF